MSNDLEELKDCLELGDRLIIGVDPAGPGPDKMSCVRVECFFGKVKYTPITWSEFFNPESFS